MPWTKPPCSNETPLAVAVAGTLIENAGLVALGTVRTVAPSGMPGPEIVWPTMMLLRTKRLGTMIVEEPATVETELSTMPAAPASTLTILEPAVVETPRM